MGSKYGRFLITRSDYSTITYALLKNRSKECFNIVNLDSENILSSSFKSKEDFIKDLNLRKEIGMILDFKDITYDISLK